MDGYQADLCGDGSGDREESERVAVVNADGSNAIASAVHAPDPVVKRTPLAGPKAQQAHVLIPRVERSGIVVDHQMRDRKDGSIGNPNGDRGALKSIGDQIHGCPFHGETTPYHPRVEVAEDDHENDCVPNPLDRVEGEEEDEEEPDDNECDCRAGPRAGHRAGFQPGPGSGNTGAGVESRMEVITDSAVIPRMTAWLDMMSRFSNTGRQSSFTSSGTT